MEKQELIELAKKKATEDALSAEGDFSNLEDEDELFDVAETAWRHCGYIFLSEDESLEEFRDVINEMESELSTEYVEMFVDTIIDKYSLKFA